MSSNLLSLIGWTFLPDLVTGWTQSLYYALTIRAGDPRPQPGTPRFAEHRRRIYILVVSAYLAYTIYEADYELRRAGSFYQDLGVPLTATDREIKSRFRRLAALHHPDKAGTAGGFGAGSGSGPGLSPDEVNAYFVHLKTAADTLLDPARRFAYDRFGPDVLAWANPPVRCITIYDFVGRGVRSLLPYYAAAAAGLYLLGQLGFLASGGAHERWLVLVCVLVFELYTVSRPTHPAVLTRVVNPLLGALDLVARHVYGAAGPARWPYLPFQAVSLARKLSITSFIGFSRIGPMLGADTRSGQIVTSKAASGGGGGSSSADDPVLQAALAQLEGVSRSLDADAGRLLELELAPFVGQTDMQGSLRAKIQHWLVQNTIRADPMVRDAVGRSLQRRRTDAPAGARGTK